LAEFPVYEEGQGVELQINGGAGNAYVVIAIVESDSKALVLDIKMTSTAGLNRVDLTQQFHLSLKGGKIAITQAFISSPLWEGKTYKMEAEYLKGYEGVQMDSFLFGKDLPNSFQFLGDSVVTSYRGEKIKSKKFKFEENSQVIEFWLSDKIKPFGLAAIKSKGPKPDQNYIIGYKATIKGYKSKIDAKKSLEMTSKIKAYLPKIKSRKSLFLP
jgi:hypothetical protein